MLRDIFNLLFISRGNIFVCMKRQKDIIKATGIHQATISNIMNGRRRPSWSMAKKLAEATGTDVSIWMEGSPEEIRSAVFKAA